MFRIMRNRNGRRGRAQQHVPIIEKHAPRLTQPVARHIKFRPIRMGEDLLGRMPFTVTHHQKPRTQVGQSGPELFVVLAGGEAGHQQATEDLERDRRINRGTRALADPGFSADKKIDDGLNAFLTKQQIGDFGWRIPFLIGCLIVPFIFFIRRSLQETQAFAKRTHHPTTREILGTVAANWRIVLLGMMLTTMTTVTFYMITVYTPTFGKTVLKLTETDSLIVTLCVAVTNFIWLPVGGALSDAIGRKPVLLTISTLSLLTTYPTLHWLVADPTFGKMLAVELWFSFFFGVYNGAMVVSLSEVVPAHVRASGFSLAYSLATALFGTATPMVSTYLIERTGDRAAPSYWLMAAAACGIIATLSLFRGRPQVERVPAHA